MDQKLLKIAALSFITLGSGLALWIITRPNGLTRSLPGIKSKKKLRKRDITSLKNSSEWENVGHLKNIWIYPIKSCAGISLQETTIEKFGPTMGKCQDRSLVIINSNGDMMTARKYGSMLLLTTEYDNSNDRLVLNFPHLQPITIYLSMVELEGSTVETKIWDDIVIGYDCGDEASDWLSLALGLKCRLLYHGPSVTSKRNTEHLMESYPLMNCDDNALYADETSVMLMNEASISDLENRTSRKLPAQNFRPNFLVVGPALFDEDDWTYVKIGECIFRNIKPCDRCILTTIDYKTGKRDKDMEPLRTLKRFRIAEGSKDPSFGIGLGVDTIGKVKIGDDVYVLRT